MHIVEHWHELNFGIAILIFFVYIFVDGLWAHYTLSVQKRNAANAATTGALMYFFLAFGVISYTQNYLYLLPLALGSWVGTYIVVKRDSMQVKSLKK